tara:strand:+ start:319 stop:504 length:186 start_codon:yes stop_codon:yes gene_type:complete
MNKDNIVSVKKIEDGDGVLLSYQVVWNTDINTFVPNVTDNTDYQTVQEWEAIDGNTIADAD